MNKGISFYFGFEISPKLRARMISEAGFTHVITSADKKYNKQNGTLRQQAKWFKENNLMPSSLHMAYNTNLLPYFWKEGKIGDRIKNLYS